MKKFILLATLIVAFSSCEKLGDENVILEKSISKSKKSSRLGSDNVAFWMDWAYQPFSNPACVYYYTYTRDEPITIYAHATNQGNETVKKVFKFWCGDYGYPHAPEYYSTISIDGTTTYAGKTVTWRTPDLAPGQSANFTFQIIKLSAWSTSQWEGTYHMSESVNQSQGEYLYLTYSNHCR